MIIKVIPETEEERQRMQEVSIENVQEFLMKYSKHLYNRHMQNIVVNISF